MEPPMSPERTSSDTAPGRPGQQPEDEGLPHADPKTPEVETTKKKGRLRTAIVSAVLAVAAVLLILFAWGLPPFSTVFERTENAYVRGQVTVISPQVSGYVAEVLASDFEPVVAGQPLFRIDDRIYRQHLDQARATLAAGVAELASSRAQLARAEADMRRVGNLAADGSLSLRERDETRAALRAAQANVSKAETSGTVSARAAVRLAEIDLANTVITAPQAGQLGQVGARRGQYVTAGSQLVSLVPPELWIIANFKERQVGLMTKGQRAVVTVDALGDHAFAGRVQRISPATGSEFALLPAQNATGNFTKVAQRLAVRIVLDVDQEWLDRLRPGMSVVARVDTRATGQGRR
jgi:RND family efflux transporter MFP subunit